MGRGLCLTCDNSNAAGKHGPCTAMTLRSLGRVCCMPGRPAMWALANSFDPVSLPPLSFRDSIFKIVLRPTLQHPMQCCSDMRGGGGVLYCRGPRSLADVLLPHLAPCSHAYTRDNCVSAIAWLNSRWGCALDLGMCICHQSLSTAAPCAIRGCTPLPSPAWKLHAPFLCAWYRVCGKEQGAVSMHAAASGRSPCKPAVPMKHVPGTGAWGCKR
eukprot:350648-Chlamydomonas_euryale.AAC.3